MHEGPKRYKNIIKEEKNKDAKSLVFSLENWISYKNTHKQIRFRIELGWQWITNQSLVISFYALHYSLSSTPFIVSKHCPILDIHYTEGAQLCSQIWQNNNFFSSKLGHLRIFFSLFIPPPVLIHDCITKLIVTNQNQANDVCCNYSRKSLQAASVLGCIRQAYSYDN